MPVICPTAQVLFFVAQSVTDYDFISPIHSGFNSRQSHVTRSEGIILGVGRPNAGLAGVTRLLLLE
jgi:hypothetical protein